MISAFNIRNVAFVGSLGQGSLGADNDAGGPVLDFVLDQLSFTAVRAYSFRRLRRLYTGPVCRVRKEGTTSEIDIYADSTGWRDDAAIAAFCGTSRGLISRIYEQMGTGDYMGQGTSSVMPVVWDGTSAIKTAGNKPGMLLYVSTDTQPHKTIASQSQYKTTLQDFYEGGSLYTYIEQTEAGQGHVTRNTSYRLRIDDGATSTSVRAGMAYNPGGIGGEVYQYMDANESFTTAASLTWNVNRSTDAGQLYKGTSSIATVSSLIEDSGIKLGLLLGDIPFSFRGIICELIQFATPISTGAIDILDGRSGNGFTCSTADIVFDFTTDTDWITHADTPLWRIPATGTTADIYIKTNTSPYTDLPPGYRANFRLLSSSTIDGTYVAGIWYRRNVVDGKIQFNSDFATSLNNFYKIECYFTKDGCASLGDECTPFVSDIYTPGVTPGCPAYVVFTPNGGTDVDTCNVKTSLGLIDPDLEIGVNWDLQKYTGGVWGSILSGSATTYADISIASNGTGTYRIIASGNKTGCGTTPDQTSATFTVT